MLSRPDLSCLPDDAKAKLAHELRFARSRELITVRFGSDPAGLRDCLAKMRDRYESPDSYDELHQLFVDPAALAARQRLMRKRIFDDAFIDVVPRDLVKLRLLGEPFMHRQLVERIGRPWRTAEIVRLVRFMRRLLPGAIDRDHAAILIAADPQRPLERALTCYLPLREASPRDALAAHPSFELIATSRQLHRAAREFRNCLASPPYERAVRTDRHVLVVWRGKDKAVLHLARFGGLWRVLELKGPGNKPVPAPTVDILTATLEPIGILGPRNPYAEPW